MSCFCGSSQNYDVCCGPYHRGERWPETAEKLMRSRYSAFCCEKIDYLAKTTHPQLNFNFNETKQWASEVKFTKLDVLWAKEDGLTAQVEFKATFVQDGKEHIHHELSSFRKDREHWFYRNGRFLT